MRQLPENFGVALDKSSLMKEALNNCELLTLAEASRLLKLSKTKLYYERKAGRLRAVRFGRTVRIRQEDLRKFVRQASRTPP